MSQVFATGSERLVEWFGNDRRRMYAAIVEHTRQVLDQTGIKYLISTGTAVENLRTTSLNVDNGMDLSRDLSIWTRASRATPQTALCSSPSLARVSARLWTATPTVSPHRTHLRRTIRLLSPTRMFRQPSWPLEKRSRNLWKSPI